MLTKFIYLAVIACVKCCQLSNSSASDTSHSIDTSIQIKPNLPDSIDASSSNINEINNSTSFNTTEPAIDSKLRKLTISNEINEKPLICYYGSWAVYRPGDGKFNVEDIDPHVCTHLVYGFAGLSYNNEIISLDSWNDLAKDYGKNAFGRFTGLKKKNDKLKTILAIGGWNEGSIKYSNMAKSETSRKTFVNSVLKMLEAHNFDGLDLDWEYAASRGGKPEDKQNLVKLLAELKEAFKPKGYLLTAAVSAGHFTIDVAYDIPNVSKYLDYINVMAYDFHGAWDQKTGHNSPLYPRPDESAADAKLTVDFAIKYWLKNGAAKEKIILGIGTYGRTFTLANSQQHGYNAPITGPGAAGPFTREPSTLGYNEFCEAQSSWTIVQDNNTKVPYAYKGNQWIGYDDIASVNLKARYANEMGLGGAMIWSIETDDFRGKCGQGKFPLLASIRKGLNGQTVENPDSSTSTPFITPSSTTVTTSTSTTPSSTTPSSTTTSSTTPSSQSTSQSTSTTTPSSTSSSTTDSSSTTTSSSSSSTTTQSSGSSTTTQNPDKFVCKEEGFFRKKDDCAIFYRCVYVGEFGEDGLKYRLFEYRCPAGTVFDDQTSLCVWPSAVKGCENYYGDSTNQI